MNNLFVKIGIFSFGLQICPLQAQDSISDQSIKSLEIKVAQGNDTAMVRLGNIYEWGKGIDKNPTMALKLYQIAAGKKNKDAACNCARIFIEGKAGKPNTKEGTEWLSKAITWGSGRAAYMYGYYHFKGKYLAEDDNKALGYFKQAAALKHPEGTAYLAHCYSNGYGTEENLDLAVKYWITAADLGDTWAAGKAAHFYYKGVKVKKDIKLAAQLFKRAIEANEYSAASGYAEYLKHESKDIHQIEQFIVFLKKGVARDHDEAISELGHCYKTGIGVAKSPAKAAQYLKKYADTQGEPMLYNGVVHCFTSQIPPMWKEAIPYFEEYHKLQPNSITCIQVAEAWLQGHVDGKTNQKEALKWYKRAYKISKNKRHLKKIDKIRTLKAGESWNNPTNAFSIMIKRDLAKLKKRAEAGEIQATLQYVERQYKNNSANVNSEEIVTLLTTTAAKDGPSAFLLAELYERGVLGKVDLPKARSYYSKAYKLGMIEAYWKNH